jgi:hypothetical protein
VPIKHIKPDGPINEPTQWLQTIELPCKGCHGLMPDTSFTPDDGATLFCSWMCWVDWQDRQKKN